MEFSAKDVITPEEILAEVLLYVDEVEFKNFTKGFFISQMRKCLEALSYDTFFHEDHISFDVPANRIIEIPAGVFNIKQMYLFSGDVCNVQRSVNVYFKRNFFHLGSEGFFARSQFNNQNDPFYAGTGLSTFPNNKPASIFTDDSNTFPSNLYFFGYSEGNIMLSKSCSSFSKVMIRFNGIWTQDGKPVIPRFLRDVVIDWCTERALRGKKALLQEPRWRQLWADSKADLNMGGFKGSWYTAENRIKRMGSKQREDLVEYLARPNI